MRTLTDIMKVQAQLHGEVALLGIVVGSNTEDFVPYGYRALGCY